MEDLPPQTEPLDTAALAELIAQTYQLREDTTDFTRDVRALRRETGGHLGPSDAGRHYALAITHLEDVYFRLRAAQKALERIDA